MEALFAMSELFSVEKAARLQVMLSRRVLNELDRFPLLDFSKIKYIAAFDSSYAGGKQCAVAVVYDCSLHTVVEKTYSAVNVKVPYIPGFLAFREIPGYMRAYSKLTIEPDLILVDGHGLAHPRAFGIATHIGLVLGKPSIGVAKHRLYGEIIKDEVSKRRIIIAHGRTIGEVIEHNNSELYVSIGYRIRLEDAVKLVKNLLVENKKLPIPLQLADEYSKIIKNKYCK
ncbi:MAG: endonuclease V [Desulfurococcaceae archaeon]